MEDVGRDAPLRVRVEGSGRLALEPLGGGIAAPLGRLLAIVVGGAGRGELGAVEGLPGGGLPLGVYERVAQPLPHVVLDAVCAATGPRRAAYRARHQWPD